MMMIMTIEFDTSSADHLFILILILVDVSYINNRREKVSSKG